MCNVGVIYSLDSLERNLRIPSIVVSIRQAPEHNLGRNWSILLGHNYGERIVRVQSTHTHICAITIHMRKLGLTK